MIRGGGGGVSERFRERVSAPNQFCSMFATKRKRAAHGRYGRHGIVFVLYGKIWERWRV